MGLYLHTHITSYIKVPTQYEDVDNIVNLCLVHGIKNDNKFCDECGTKLVTRTCRETTEKDWQDIMPDLRDCINVHVEDDFVYMFNSDENINEDEYTHLFTEINEDIVSKSNEEFASSYKDIIDKVNKYLGVEVKIHFGIINYWH